MPTRNVLLTDHDDRFIDMSIATGRFGNASEAVRAGLHLLERQEAEDREAEDREGEAREADDRVKVQWLCSTTRDAFAAFDQGEGVPMASAEDIDAMVNDAIEESRASRRTSHA